MRCAEQQETAAGKIPPHPHDDGLVGPEVSGAVAASAVTAAAAATAARSEAAASAEADDVSPSNPLILVGAQPGPLSRLSFPPIYPRPFHRPHRHVPPS